jgi:hypothetical protein
MEAGTDILAYVGPLSHGLFPMVRVPEARLTRHLYMSGRILDRQAMSPELLQMSNWKVNLGSFDVR